MLKTLTIYPEKDSVRAAEDDEFFAGIPEVAYTGQQPEDYPLRRSLGWEPEPEATPPTATATSRGGTTK